MTGDVVTSIQLAKYDTEGHDREIFLTCLRYGMKSLDGVSGLQVEKKDYGQVPTRLPPMVASAPEVYIHLRFGMFLLH